MKVELRVRLGKPGSGWNEGKPLRGEREIWILDESGVAEYWGYVLPEYHGCHGMSYHIYNIVAHEVGKVFPRESGGSRSTWVVAGVTIEKLIQSGVLESPAVLKARRAAMDQCLSQLREDERRKQDRIMRVLHRLYRVANDVETRVGLNDAYKEIFCVNIPEEVS